MKIMKKIFKNSILTFALGVILAGSISVYAAGRYYANQVDYEPSNPSFNVDNMADALDQLYTTQNTTISNLNNQVTTLTGQVSAKDATISELQTQLNGISTTDCIRGTMDLSSQCKTSSGCLVENQFAPSYASVTITTYSDYQFILGFDKKIGNIRFGAYTDYTGFVDPLSNGFRISGNSLYMTNISENLSGKATYVACR